MKKFLEKSWKYFIVLPFLAILLAGIFLNLPKGEKELFLSASNMKVEVGESMPISCEANIEGTTYSFTLADDSIALIDENTNEIYGVKEGITNLYITASYRNSLATKEIVVEVFSSIKNPDESIETPDKTQDSDNFESDNENEVENVPGEDSGEVFGDENNSSQIIVKSFFDEISSLEIKVGEFAVIEIICDEEYTFSDSPNLIIEKVDMTENRYKITATKIGKQILKITTSSASKELTIIAK